MNENTGNGPLVGGSDPLAEDVERARQSFSESLELAAGSGERALARAAARAKPILIAAAAIAGVTLVVVAIYRSRRRPRIAEARLALAPPASSSLAGTVVRSIAGALASAALRKLTAEWLEKRLVPEGEDVAECHAPKGAVADCHDPDLPALRKSREF